MVHNNNGVPYRANILMYLKYSIAITTRHYYVCCRDGDYRINGDRIWENRPVSEKFICTQVITVRIR